MMHVILHYPIKIYLFQEIRNISQQMNKTFVELKNTIQFLSTGLYTGSHKDSLRSSLNSFYVKINVNQLLVRNDPPSTGY